MNPEYDQEFQNYSWLTNPENQRIDWSGWGEGNSLYDATQRSIGDYTDSMYQDYYGDSGAQGAYGKAAATLAANGIHGGSALRQHEREHSQKLPQRFQYA